jgi:hypothetical protein
MKPEYTITEEELFELLEIARTAKFRISTIKDSDYNPSQGDIDSAYDWSNKVIIKIHTILYPERK